MANVNMFIELLNQIISIVTRRFLIPITSQLIPAITQISYNLEYIVTILLITKLYDNNANFTNRDNKVFNARSLFCC